MVYDYRCVSFALTAVVRFGLAPLQSQATKLRASDRRTESWPLRWISSAKAAMPRLLRQPLLFLALQLQLRPSLRHQARQKTLVLREAIAAETRLYVEAIRTPSQRYAFCGYRCERRVSWHGAVSWGSFYLFALFHDAVYLSITPRGSKSSWVNTNDKVT